jgi:hypothetical protein
MTIKHLLPGLAFAACVLLPAPARAADAVPVPPAGTRIDSVLVSVNGEPITMLDVILETGDREMEFAGIYSGERLNSKTLSLRKETVDQIVFRKLVFEKYKTEPFDIPRQEVENLLDEYVRASGAESRAALEKNLLPFGITPEKLREKAIERIAFDIILMRDCDRQVYVTPKEVYEDYKAHPEKWTVPEKITLQMLQINVTAGSAGGDPETAVKAIRKELDEDSSQKNFTRLVLERSDGATASSGGVNEGVEFDKLRPEFIEALKGKKAGDVVGPIEAPEAFFFLRVVGTEPARLIPFSQASREVRDALFQAKIEEKRKEFQAQIRRNAVVHYFFD